MNRIQVMGAALVLLCTGALPVSAAGPRGVDNASGGDRPWAKGVPEAERTRALELFREGNGLLKDSIFAQAATRYREALKHWDHPAIHYNLVLALLTLDQPLEVREHLEKAMRYGAEPLDADKFEQARAYKALVEGQLARVKVTCEVEGASVVMDGRPLFVAPGKFEGWVRAGPHTIVATREGYLTYQDSPTLVPGKVVEIPVKLYRSEDLTQYRRRFGAWLPWTVMGAGAAVALGGGVMHMTARNDIRAFDAGITECGGCVPSVEMTSQLSRGQGMQSYALGGYALGGAAVATGAILLYLNQPQLVQLTPEELNESGVSVSVAPILAPGQGGATALIRF